MRILAIETSCDETAAAVVEQKTTFGKIKVLSSVVATSLELHIQTGGVVPEVAAREQLTYMLPTIHEALEKARFNKDALDGIAVTQGPGLIGSLLVGVETAKALALTWHKPLIAVNHLLGHLLVNWVREGELPLFPAMGLVVSGGHTDLVWLNSPTDYRWIGGTRDDAAGECFDKCARILLNAPYPGGPAISQAALQVVGPVLPFLPRPMLHDPGLEMSFSGLKTAVYNLVRSIKTVDATYKATVAYDLEQAISDVLIKKTNSAIEHYKPASLLVGGGVVANAVFRDRLSTLENELNLPVFYPPLTYCSDNAVMVGSAGLMTRNVVQPQLLKADPSLGF